MPSVLADLVAATHLLVILAVLAGGLLAWRWRGLLWVHVPLALTVAAVNLSGAECPLTALELALREQGGRPGYPGGFIEHYLVTPVHPAGITPAVQVGIYVAVLAPNLLAYARLLARSGTGRWALSSRAPASG